MDADLGVPSGAGFIALLEAFRDTGGTAPGEFVGRLLEDHQEGHLVSLAKLIYTGQLFGFEWRTSLWVPMFQLAAGDLAVQRGPQQVRAALPPMGSGWAVACWFAAGNPLLGGRRPVDLLNTDLGAVLAAAGAQPAVQGLAPAPARRAPALAARV